MYKEKEEAKASKKGSKDIGRTPNGKEKRRRLREEGPPEHERRTRGGREEDERRTRGGRERRDLRLPLAKGRSQPEGNIRGTCGERKGNVEPRPRERKDQSISLSQRLKRPKKQ